jgi:two-component system, NarL family, nitrate/nitrite response regulator NarL
MRDKIKVFIVDDQLLFRKALSCLLMQHDSSIVVAGEAENGKALLDLAKRKLPDIVLLDLEMPVMDGKQALEVMTARYPQSSIIMLTMHYSPELVNSFMKRGVKAYLPKDCKVEVLLDAIHTVFNGGQYFDSLFMHNAPEIKNSYSVGNYAGKLNLTARETEIIKCICQGKTNKEIAHSLNIAQRTVDFHRGNIYEKTQVGNPAALAVYAVKHGIISV